MDFSILAFAETHGLEQAYGAEVPVVGDNGLTGTLTGFLNTDLAVKCLPKRARDPI